MHFLCINNEPKFSFGFRSPSFLLELFSEPCLPTLWLTSLAVSGVSLLLAQCSPLASVCNSILIGSFSSLDVVSMLLFPSQICAQPGHQSLPVSVSVSFLALFRCTNRSVPPRVCVEQSSVFTNSPVRLSRSNSFPKAQLFRSHHRCSPCCHCSQCHQGPTKSFFMENPYCCPIRLGCCPRHRNGIQFHQSRDKLVVDTRLVVPSRESSLLT